MINININIYYLLFFKLFVLIDQILVIIWQKKLTVCKTKNVTKFNIINLIPQFVIII